MASELIKQLTEESFKSTIASGVVLVDFYADWCGPCRMLAPVIEELAQEFSDKVTFGKVDTDQAVNVAAEYEVHSIPTLILFKNGSIVKKMVGLKDLETLRKMVQEVL